MNTMRLRRLPLIAAAMLLLLGGLWGGVARLGWPLPGELARAVVYHGPLMISGFLGTLIALERAVALGRWWCYGAPLFSIAGALALLAGMPQPVGASLMTLAGAALMLDFLVIFQRQATMFTITMGLGALAWTMGTALWLQGYSLLTAVAWWIGFLVLTIVGERLELTRLLPRLTGQQSAFIAVVALYLTGLVLIIRWPVPGWSVTGVGFIGLAVWLATFDLARRTVRHSGLTRFIAVCLLAGYGWLAIAGVLILTRTLPAWIMGTPDTDWVIVSGVTYDALLHAIFLGFVFSMIFGHAPIIFPAILGIRMKYSARFYAHLVLLHLSLMLRIFADVGDLSGVQSWAALFNVLSVLLFVINNVTALRLDPDETTPIPVRSSTAAAPMSLSRHE